MRNQYTILSSAPSRNYTHRKKRNYPESLNCQYCEKPFKPTKDRKRFCSSECFRNWERSKALETRPFGRSEGRAAKAKSAASIKDFRKLENSFADRCQYWMQEFEREFQEKSNLSGKREIRLPLVLTGHGISLNIKSGCLNILNGLTHYPQDREEFRYFPGKHNTPSRIILLGRNGSISVDALCWLSAQNIPLVVLDYQGNELSCISSASGQIDYEVRIAQLIATRPEIALSLAKGLIRAKIAGQLGNLNLWPESQPRRYAEHKLLSHLETLETVGSVSDLMVIEATAALSYFKLWQYLDVAWTSKSQRFVPSDWSFVSGRESKVSGVNRNASHPVNAILNYGYAVLESQVRIAAAMLGLDTSVSYLHAMKHGRSSLIFDLMEPLRPKLDRLLIGFIRQTSFTKDDFSLSINGVCKLNPQFARRIVSISLADCDVQRSVTAFRDELLTSFQAVT